MTASVVSGIFDDYGVARKVIAELTSSGIDRKDIEVLGSKQEAALTLKSQVHPAEELSYLEKAVLFGAVLGGIFALCCFLVSAVHTNITVGILATACGIGAGGYLGLLFGAVGKFDIGQDDAHFKEEEMTKGRIWVGVKAENDWQTEVSQKIMGDLGAIRLDPQSGVYDEHWTQGAFVWTGVTGAAFLFTLAILTEIAIHRGTGDISSVQRILLFICFVGLLLDTMVIAYAGFKTRGARKWLHFDVAGALRSEKGLMDKEDKASEAVEPNLFESDASKFEKGAEQ